MSCKFPHNPLRKIVKLNSLQGNVLHYRYPSINISDWAFLIDFSDGFWNVRKSTLKGAYFSWYGSGFRNEVSRLKETVTNSLPASTSSPDAAINLAVLQYCGGFYCRIKQDFNRYEWDNY